MSGLAGPSQVFRRVIAGALAACAALSLGGCGGYVLKGRVIHGDFNGLQIVTDDDPRITAAYGDNAGLGDGLPSARVEVTLDADRVSRRRVGVGGTDAAGRFAIPIDLAGVGFMMHDVQIQVRRDGFEGLTSAVDLPGGGKRVLVELKPGRDAVGDSRSFLEQTLDDSKPYLE